ncbi:uncharacterized protein DNG_09916 [Cephalotrichum gorgonifer]|uniref:Uncharacterized protein n=1 Tax=Cephalotrichum gorgonifer TaxID=2041049 RepID=A0AAE8N6R9_9PEZI|nr:uncharacterized protein DNG_09916 [Cephalotrichum gorgonifer]
MSDQNFHKHHHSKHMPSAGFSNPGFPSIHSDGDHHNVSRAEVEEASRESGHNLRGYMSNYSKNQEPIATQVHEERERMYPHTEADLAKKDPMLPAMMHNNEPSRGARIDAELMAEDAEELRRKGKA